MKLLVLVFLMILMAFATNARAADGEPDATFNGSGSRIHAVDLTPGGYDAAEHALPAPDGSVFLVGTASTATGSDLVITKLTATGGIDTAYGLNGEAVLAENVAGNYLDGIGATLQDDGKLIVALTITRSVAPFDDNILVARFNSDGSLDNSFNNDGIIPIDAGGQRRDSAHAVAIDSQGRILVAGSHDTASGTVNMLALRLTPNGFLDASFAGGIRTAEFFTNQGATASSIAVNGADEVFVGGYTLTGVSDYDFAIWKLTSIGQNDNSFSGDGLRTVAFDVGGFTDDFLLDIALLPEGGLIAVGSADDGTMDRHVAATLIDTDSGNIVTGFGNQTPDNGLLIHEFTTVDANNGDLATGVAIQPDGKFVLALTLDSAAGLELGSLRLFPDGSFDATWGNLGFHIYPRAQNEFSGSMALDSLNRPLLAGGAQFGGSDYDYLVMRLENTNDVIFNAGFGGDLP